MMKQATSRRVLAMLVVFSLCFSMLGWSKTEAQATDTKKIVVYVAIEGENASGASVTVDKTPVLIDAEGKASDAIKAVLDKSEYKGNYKMTENSWGLSLDEINGLSTEQVGTDWLYWNFYVNGAYAEVGIGDYILKDQDKVGLIYTSFGDSLEKSLYSDDISLNPTEERRTELLNRAIKNKNTLAAVIFRDTFENGAKIPTIGARADEMYTVYSLAKAGLCVPSFYKNVYNQLAKDLVTLESGKKLTDGSTAESIEKSGYASSYYAKIALAVSAMGYDASNVEGVNLIEKLVDKKLYDASEAAATYGAYGRDGLLLTALDEAKAKLPEDEKYVTRATLIQALIKDVDSSIETAVSWQALDSAAMAIQGLENYVNTKVDGIDQDAVKQAVDRTMRFMENSQTSKGSVGNVWTLAQVMNTVGRFDVDVTSETSWDFIKNGNTLYDQASSKVDPENQKVDSELMSFQPEQLLRGYATTIQASISAGAIYTEVVTTAAIGQVVEPAALEEQTVKLAKSKITSVSKSGKISFKKVKNAKKYQIQIAQDKGFKKNLVTKTTTKTNVSYKFKKNKKYYVRVRALNGKNKGAFSAVKVIKK